MMLERKNNKKPQCYFNQDNKHRPQHQLSTVDLNMLDEGCTNMYAGSAQRVCVRVGGVAHCWWTRLFPR